MAITRPKRRIFQVKKRHCLKNVLLSRTDRWVLYLSATYPGSHHDKAIADEQDFEFQRTIELLQDTGFQGYQPRNAHVIQPLKKPRGKELTEEQKQDNRAKASKRVVIEHAIAGLKVWRIAKDVCRSWLYDTRDYFILIACALHNFRLKCRNLISYSV